MIVSLGLVAATDCSVRNRAKIETGTETSLFDDVLFSPLFFSLHLPYICTVFIFLNRCSPRYIVYDVAQINLKYLLKIKFNYQTSLW